MEKQIAKVVRYAAKNLAMNLEYNSNVKVSDLNEILGSSKLDRTIYENNKVAGVVTGLAWTRVGGDILFIESIISKGIITNRHVRLRFPFALHDPQRFFAEDNFTFW